MDVERCIAFIEARLADDEAVANAASPKAWTTTKPYEGMCDVVSVDIPRTHITSAHEFPCCEVENAKHIALHDPERVLVEVQGKRDLLALARKNPEGDFEWWWDRRVAAPILCALARVWRTHPDYLLAWEQE